MTKSKMLTSKIAVTLAAFLIGCAAQGTGLANKGGVKASFEPVTYNDILNDDKTVGDVVTYGLGQKGQRYSTLKQINKKSIKDLVPVWNFSFGGEKMRGQESQPLVKDGVMYVTGSYSRLYALDIATGREIWNYEAKLPDNILPCCDVINRGAALIDNLVIFGTLDAKLVALDRATGKVVWKKTIADYKDGYSFTAAPLIVKGLVVTGVSGGEFGIVGKVEARDPKTGEIVWSRPTVEGHMGYLNGKENGISGTLNATWEGDQWQHGGAAPWNGVTYDPDTDLIYVPTGNPSPWNSHERAGNNLYSACRMAINPDTGKIVWYYQTTPNDGWDFDGMSELVLFDYKDASGKTVKAGATADKNGFFYVLNRENGKFISASPFVDGITWAKGIDKDGKPIVNPENRPGEPVNGEKGKTVFTVPSFLGGKNWNPMAYSQRTGLFYVPANEWGMDMWNQPVTYKKGAAYMGAGFTIKPVHEDHIGALKAIDPKTGKIKWKHENVAPLWGGVLATAGGVVFTGTPEGELLGLDDETGKVLYSFQVGSGIVGSPITWEQDGEQYVAVVSGWGGAVPLWGGEVAKSIKHISQGGMVHVFKLHKNK
ncbi:PQQ-dependent methanol/ethanol family dehydrogenase [Sulfuricurvum sp.]|uniref:PQQ-dependent methanol/ethanol family dehydrogenase n=1 Tax=Sulfuricurvum sp. TaxID=2025608 RepID=UPI00260F00B5|nr:PQQ-dependent methanol/ethanol family dehydrogenase [Sulfuricurvum sp.]MDD2266764.1 PQQ-dependent methanol/ethanol family dehydrogenase [Sulfuricurvum sp.]MDD2784587.1 PQQ-dependent methanol/ethanol family dehydrogenase [Sulfuricurvum sp.]